MATIQVIETGRDDQGFTFHVVVEEAGSVSSHDVTLSRRDYEDLGARSASPEQFIRRCFEYLLERESKEAILALFDIREIGRYFPRFREEVRQAQP